MLPKFLPWETGYVEFHQCHPKSWEGVSLKRLCLLRSTQCSCRSGSSCLYLRIYFITLPCRINVFLPARSQQSTMLMKLLQSCSPNRFLCHPLAVLQRREEWTLLAGPHVALVVFFLSLPISTLSLPLPLIPTGRLYQPAVFSRVLAPGCSGRMGEGYSTRDCRHQ